jgi:hypothetical protein
MSDFKTTLMGKLAQFNSGLGGRPNTFREALIFDFSKKVFDEINGLIQTETEELDLRRSLKTTLKNNWIKIQSTFLCYTAIPWDDITRFMCELAELLSDDAISPISLLMPDIALDSIDIEDFPSLDESPDSLLQIVRHHILGRDGQYIIPVAILGKYEGIQRNRRLPNIYFDMDRYDKFSVEERELFTVLDLNEIKRLYAHSDETKALKDAKSVYVSYAFDETHFLGRLNTLLKRMYFNGVSGVGSEEVAGMGAYPALQDFYDYYQALSEEDNALIPKGLQRELDLLHDYFVGKRVADIGSCLATRRDAIKEEINGNEVLLTSICLLDEKKSSLMDKAKTDFETIQLRLKEKLAHHDGLYKGHDNLPLTLRLLQGVGTEIYFANDEQLLSILESLSVEDIKVLMDEKKIKENVYAVLETIENWSMCITMLAPHRLNILITLIGEERLTLALMRDKEAFLALLGMLNTERLAMVLGKIDINRKDKYGYTLLISAIMEGCVETALYLIEMQDLDINVCDKCGFSALIWAVNENLIDVVDALIQKGVCLNDKNHDGDTALLLAIKKGHSDIAVRLIAARAIVNHTNRFGDSALLSAIKYSEEKIAIRLIEAGADVDMENKKGVSPRVLSRYFTSKGVRWAINYYHDLSREKYVQLTFFPPSLFPKENKDTSFRCQLL